MKKTTEPPPDWKTFTFSRREFGKKLGIEGRVVRVSVAIADVEIAMDSNPDGSRDYFHLSREELAGRLGLGEWRPFSAYAGLSKVEIRASPAPDSQERGIMAEAADAHRQRPGPRTRSGNGTVHRVHRH